MRTFACQGCGQTFETDLVFVAGTSIDQWWLEQGQTCQKCWTFVGADRAGKAHRNGSDTETAAAESVREVSGRKRLQVLALLRANPEGLTDDEGGALMGAERLDFGRRRNELADVGLVTDSGRRRFTPRGRAAAVWVLTP